MPNPVNTNNRPSGMQLGIQTGDQDAKPPNWRHAVRINPRSLKLGTQTSDQGVPSSWRHAIRISTHFQPGLNIQSNNRPEPPKSVKGISAQNFRGRHDALKNATKKTFNKPANNTDKELILKIQQEAEEEASRELDVKLAKGGSGAKGQNEPNVAGGQPGFDTDKSIQRDEEPKASKKQVIMNSLLRIIKKDKMRRTQRHIPITLQLKALFVYMTKGEDGLNKFLSKVFPSRDTQCVENHKAR